MRSGLSRAHAMQCETQMNFNAIKGIRFLLDGSSLYNCCTAALALPCCRDHGAGGLKLSTTRRSTGPNSARSAAVQEALTV